jgi:hypothetical protein
MVAETGEKGNLPLTVHLLKYPTINQNPKHDVRVQQEAREDTGVKENAEGITTIAARSVTNFYHLVLSIFTPNPDVRNVTLCASIRNADTPPSR